MSRSTAAGYHTQQTRYLVDRRGECRVVADTSPITAAVSVIAISHLPHKECAALLRQLAREVEQQP